MKPILCLFLALFIVNPVAESPAQQLRVMSFNLWHGGEAGGQPLAQTIHVIRKSQADIVGLQETHGHEVDGVRPDNGQIIAKSLGWHYFPQGGRTGILSRFELGAATKNKWGVEIEYAPGRTLLFVNAHFAASPYEPYQLLDIPYGDAPFIKTEAETIDWANRSRGQQVDRLLLDIQEATTKHQRMILTGDFNEPSFQDWTTRAARANFCPLRVEYPATKRITNSGLTDAWRVAHPNEVEKPGWTWTPTTKPDDPTDRHDRIDFVFVSSQGIRVKNCQRVAEPGNADIVVSPWPSDHRAVLATIEIVD